MNPMVAIGFLSLATMPMLALCAATLTASDIVDRSSPARETELSPADFASPASFREVDLTKLGIETSSDPTMGKHVEGDIAMTNIKKFVDDSNKLGRNAIRQMYRRWPNGEIPYTISSQYGSYSRSIIARAMQEFHEKTCVRFVPRDEFRHRDYLYIHPDDGCYSLVGRTGGRQPVSLDSGCIQTGTIMHELNHALGFFHEQSRSDRDEFIEIVWHNVMNGADDQFDKYGLNVIDQLGEPYDYASIMHYGPYAFSDNGRRTIVPRRAGAEKMGQRMQFSESDLRKINKLYTCSSLLTGPTSSSQPASTIVDPLDVVILGECEDKNWRCSFYSLAIFDYCSKHPEIRALCQKSCGACTAATPSAAAPAAPRAVCRDLNPTCPRWARRGECEGGRQKSYMRVICALSCGTCQDPAAGSASTASSMIAFCEDSASFFTCKATVVFGQCDDRKQECRKSCSLC